MRHYLKEILISAAALLVLTLAVWAYIRSVRQEKSGVELDIFTLVPGDARALLVVNRPAVFDRMILSNQGLSRIFASEIPPVLLSVMKKSKQIQAVTFSFHPEGVVCYLQAGNRVIRSLEDDLEDDFYGYAPISQVNGGVTYRFYPDTANLFLSTCQGSGYWIASYNRKLLEQAVSQRSVGQVWLPDDMSWLRSSFDKNALMNVVFPTHDLNLYVTLDNLSEWRVTDQWMAADLFVSEDSFCCYGSFPFYPQLRASTYKSMGDTLAQRLQALYPSLRLSFQISKENESVYYTGCTPF